MNVKIRNIPVDADTAERLEARATARGMSVSELLAELLVFDLEPMAADIEAISELDRRWSTVKSGRATVPNDDVVRWLQTWGTPAFRRWHDR
jgi:hypothetical protein